jgi:type I restriction enzyme M protein
MTSSSATWTLLDTVRGEPDRAEAVIDACMVAAALRWADAHDAEREAIAVFNGDAHEPLLPAQLRWSAWSAEPHALDEDELATLWAGIHDALELPPDPRALGVSPVRLSPKSLAAVARWADALMLDTPAGRREASDAVAALVTRALKTHQGEMVTPRAVGQLMVALANPQPGERIYDPCFGTGGLLLAAADALWARGREVSAAEWEAARRTPLFGVERQAFLHLVGFARLLLAGVRPGLDLGDALEREAAGRHHDQGFDCVLADPPWGMRPDASSLYDFAIRGHQSENLFVQHAVQSLRQGGRAVVAVPPGLLFRGGADQALREWLLKQYRVEAVINLPRGAFRELRSVAPSLLVLQRGGPTETVRFVDLVELPETVAASRNLARAIRAGDAEGARPHTLQTVDVIELRKADSRFEVPAELAIEANDDLALLAERVELVPLKEAADIQAGLSVSKKGWTDVPEGDAPPLVRIGSLDSHALRIGDRYLSPAWGQRPSPGQQVQRGDVLLSVKGTIGKVQHVRGAVDLDGKAVPGASGDALAVVMTGLVVLRTRPALDARFLAAVLSSRTYQALLRRLARGAVIANLGLRELRTLTVPVPPPAVQEKVLRRLAEHPGDALEALSLVLATEDEDPLTRLFRESPAIQLLVGEGAPEEAERERAALEALRELTGLRNRVVHGQESLSGDLHQWLTVLGAVPIASVLERSNGFRFEALSATQALLQSAMAPARGAGGLLGRQALRLTERLRNWVVEARRGAAGAFRLEVDQNSEASDGAGNGTVGLTLKVVGSIGVRDLVIEPGLGLEAVELGDLSAGESVSFELELHDEMDWERHPEEQCMCLDVVMRWRGRRVDGEPCEGEVDVYLTFDFPPDDDDEEDEDEAWAEYGVSPYITGDVVDNPGMFFGRKGVLDDIKTHLGGGTKVILLEGNRRTGKTSILRQLQLPEQGLEQDWIVVESSFQGTVGDDKKDGIPTEGVFRMLVRDIGLACAKAGVPVLLPDMEPVADINRLRFRFAKALNGYFADIDPYEALQIYVDIVCDAIAPRRLLLMLDEFDKLQVGIDNRVTSPQVPENIRNLLQTRPAVAAILTGSRRLKRLREEYWSALFGFGHRIGVDPLSPEEVEELVTRPVVGRLAFDSAALRDIVHLSARQPFLAQSLCARIFELAKRHEWRHITRPHVVDSAERMVRDNEHFQALWDYAETERRRYLLWACHKLAEGPHRVHAALLTQELEDKGVSVTTDQVDDDLKFLVELELIELTNAQAGPQYRLSVPLMEQWMEKNVDPEAQRRRAVTETHGGLSA